MTLMRMPLFTWTALCTSILMIFAMPPLTVATALLALDRYLGFHFFTNWPWRQHDELRQPVLAVRPPGGLHPHPAGVRRLFGSHLHVFRQGAVRLLARWCWRRWRSPFLSFTVWLHHFFTMGQSADINAAFGIATMLIGIPTGVKIYDWMLDHVPRARYASPCRWSMPRLHDAVRHRRDDRHHAGQSERSITRSTTRCSWSRISTTC